MKVQAAEPVGVEPPGSAIAGRQALRRRRAPGNVQYRRATGAALGFLLPNLLGFLAFTFFPVVFSFGMAFTNWSLKPAIPLQFVGLYAQRTGKPYRSDWQ